MLTYSKAFRGVFFLCAAFQSVPALAENNPGDYGRFSGDTALSFAVGGGVVTHAPPSGAVLGELRARYLDMAGLLIAPEYRTENTSISQPSEFRLTTAVDFRPLFLARFLKLGESGSPFLDLLIDSIGIDLGATFRFYDSSQSAGSHAGLFVGTGVDIPVVINERDGTLWFLRVGARYANFFSTQPGEPPSDWTLALTFGLKKMVRFGIAAWERPVTP